MSTGTLANPRLLLIDSPLEMLRREDTSLVAAALERHPRVGVLLDGSNMARSSHLFPFTVAERQAMLELLFADELRGGRLIALPVAHNPYDPRGGEGEALARLARDSRTAESLLKGFATTLSQPGRGRAVGEIAGRPRASLPDPVPAGSRLATAREVGAARADFLLRDDRSCADPRLEPFLDAFTGSVAYSWLREEALFCAEYRARWFKPDGPDRYETADFVATCGDFLLLVRRGNWPSKGLWALPGGFIDKMESPRDAAIREACEETRLSRKGMAACCSATRKFDFEARDPRGRIETHASRFDIAPLVGAPGRDANGCPAIAREGADDAREALWMPRSRFLRTPLMGDHGLIVERMAPDWLWRKP